VIWLLSRTCSRVALAVMLVGLPTAQAADTTLTLACQTGAHAAPTQPQTQMVLRSFDMLFRGLLLLHPDDRHFLSIQHTPPGPEGCLWT
jgi:hypothetical protein